MRQGLHEWRKQRRERQKMAKRSCRRSSLRQPVKRVPWPCDHLRAQPKDTQRSKRSTSERVANRKSSKASGSSPRACAYAVHALRDAHTVSSTSVRASRELYIVCFGEAAVRAVSAAPRLALRPLHDGTRRSIRTRRTAVDGVELDMSV